MESDLVIGYDALNILLLHLTYPYTIAVQRQAAWLNLC